MNEATVVIIIALVLSLGAMIAYFMTEGFQPMGQDSDTVCKAFTTCSTCTDDTKHPGTHCGWCPAASACIPRSGRYRIVPSWLIDIINADPTKGQCSDDTCSDYTNCKDCAGALSCGWCSASNKCLSKTAVAAAAAAVGSPPPCGSSGSGGSGGSGGSCPPPEPLCASSSFVTQSGTCPPPVCSAINDCFTCTNTTGCGYCKDTRSCVSVDGNGSALGGSSGSRGCAQGSIFTQSYQCPCSAITKCSDCAGRPGCGYCKSSSTCVNLDRNGVPEPSDCAADGAATSASQCVAGAKLGATSEGRGLNPYKNVPYVSPGEIAKTQTTLLGGNELNVPAYAGATGTGDGAVSPPSTSKYATGNGVVRPYGASAARTPIANPTGLGDAPLESYVKMLVSSELAAQGVPTNEPFQVNEVQAIPNAEGFLKNAMDNITGTK